MRFLIALLLLAGIPHPAAAQQLSPIQQQTAVLAVENYFNAVTTVQARFIQANQDGTVSSGVFSWWRPGRLRFQYDPPNNDYIVADGLLVHYWDDGIKNYSNAPLGATLADFLLRKKIKLSGDLKVVAAKRPSPDHLLLTLVQAESPNAGDLRLLFNEKPFQLEKWRVTDGAGQVTEVALSQIKTGVKLDPKLFRFIPPKGFDQEWRNR